MGCKTRPGVDTTLTGPVHRHGSRTKKRKELLRDLLICVPSVFWLEMVVPWDMGLMGGEILPAPYSQEENVESHIVMEESYTIHVLSLAFQQCLRRCCIRASLRRLHQRLLGVEGGSQCSTTCGISWLSFLVCLSGAVIVCITHMHEWRSWFMLTHLAFSSQARCVFVCCSRFSTSDIERYQSSAMHNIPQSLHTWHKLSIFPL